VLANRNESSRKLSYLNFFYEDNGIRRRIFDCYLMNASEFTVLKVCVLSACMMYLLPNTLIKMFHRLTFPNLYLSINVQLYRDCLRLADYISSKVKGAGEEGGGGVLCM
jgi:hypothetical protein